MLLLANLPMLTFAAQIAKRPSIPVKFILQPARCLCASVPTPGFNEEIVSAFEFTIDVLYIIPKKQMDVNIANSTFQNDFFLRICTNSTGAKTIGHKSPPRFKHQQH